MQVIYYSHRRCVWRWRVQMLSTILRDFEKVIILRYVNTILLKNYNPLFSAHLHPEVCSRDMARKLSLGMNKIKPCLFCIYIHMYVSILFTPAESYPSRLPRYRAIVALILNFHNIPYRGSYCIAFWRNWWLSQSVKHSSNYIANWIIS